MDGDVLDDAAGRGDGETRRGLCCVGSFMSRCVGGGRGVAPAARAGRRRRAPWCSCVAVVMRGTGGRRAGGGGLGVDDVASDGFSTQFERCAVPVRAFFGRARGPIPTRCRRRSFSRTASRSTTCAARELGGHAFRISWDLFLVQRALRRTKDREGPRLGP